MDIKAPEAGSVTLFWLSDEAMLRRLWAISPNKTIFCSSHSKSLFILLSPAAVSGHTLHRFRGDVGCGVGSVIGDSSSFFSSAGTLSSPSDWWVLAITRPSPLRSVLLSLAFLSVSSSFLSFYCSIMESPSSAFTMPSLTSFCTTSSTFSCKTLISVGGPPPERNSWY